MMVRIKSTSKGGEFRIITTITDSGTTVYYLNTESGEISGGRSVNMELIPIDSDLPSLEHFEQLWSEISITMTYQSDTYRKYNKADLFKESKP